MDKIVNETGKRYLLVAEIEIFTRHKFITKTLLFVKHLI